jgi:TonB dependent receptor
MESTTEGELAITSGAGTFFFPSLRPIYYELSVEAPGFKKHTLMGVKIDPASETSLPPIKLEIGDVKTSVETNAPLQTLQTANAEVASTANQDQVAQLPLADRDPLNVLDTIAGVNNNGRGVRTIDGLSVSFDNISFDGINTQQSFIRFNSLNSTTLGLHTDQISEVTVVTSNPGIIYSGGSGQVAFSTPGGSNVFHGSAYWLNIPRGVNAQTFYSNQSATPNAIQLNQAGASFGGPLVKDKLFFFLNFEANLDRSTTAQIPIPVPSSPLKSTNPAMQQVLNLIPSDPSGFYRGTHNDGGTTYTGLSRFDYRASSKHVFGLTTSWLAGLVDDSGDSSVYGRQGNVTNHNTTSFLSGSWRWSPTARLTNEVRIGANLPRVDFLNSLRNRFPYVLDLSQATYQGRFFDYVNPMGGTDPQGRHDYLYNYQDNLTYVKGRHTLQAGFFLQQYRLRAFGINRFDLGNPPMSVPLYLVDDVSQGTILGSQQTFNITSPTSGYLSGSTPTSHLSTNLISGYVQDNWRVLPSLSINLGVRYDYQSPAEENTGTAILPVLTGPNGVYDQNMAFAFASPGEGLYKADRNNFAPHVGFAWKTGGSIPIVVRGAYSISYVNDDLLRDLSTFAYSNPFQTDLEFQCFGDNSQGPCLSNGNSVALGKVPAVGTPALPALTLPALTKFDGFAPTIRALDPNLRTPYVQQASLGVETQVNGFQLGARYVGNRLVGGLMSVDRNQLILTPASLAYLENNGAGPNVGTFAQVFQEVFNGSGVALPYRFFGNTLAPNGIDVLSNLGRSRYDGLQFTASRRVAAGLSLTANYSYSKTLGNLGDYGQGAFNPYADNNNPSLNFAPSPYNLTHAFKGTFIYDLPFAAHTASGSFARKVLGGWSVSGIALVQSGAPFSLLSGLDSFNIPQDSGQNTVSTSLTASQIEGFFGIQKSPAGSVTYVNGFSGTAFQQPGPGTLGTLQRRMFTGPGAINVNLGVRKVITMTERMRMEFRAESINVLNNESWLVGDQTLAPNQSSFSGSVTQWIPPRSFQFHVRLSF